MSIAKVSSRLTPEMLGNVFEYVAVYSLKDDTLEFLIKPEGQIFDFLSSIDTVRKSLGDKIRQELRPRFESAEDTGRTEGMRFSLEHKIDGRDLVHIPGIFLKKDEDHIYAGFSIIPGNESKFNFLSDNRRSMYSMFGLEEGSVLLDCDFLNNIAVIVGFENGRYRETIEEDFFPDKVKGTHLDEANYGIFTDAFLRVLSGETDIGPIDLTINMNDGASVRFNVMFTFFREGHGKISRGIIKLERQDMKKDTNVRAQYNDIISKVSNIVMETAYDMTDGLRLRYLSSRIPRAFESADTVSALFTAFVGELRGDNVKSAVTQLGQMISPDNLAPGNTGEACEFNLQMKNQLGAGSGDRWYKLKYVYFTSGYGHRILCLNLVDINNEYTLMSDAIEQSVTDVFTGLPNRAGFLLYVDKIEQGKNNPPAEGKSALVLLEVDNQNELRARYSLEVCDSHLRRMADQMRLYVGEGDFISKLGDFTFLFIFHGITSIYEFNQKLRDIKKASHVSTGGISKLETTITAAAIETDDRQGYRQAYEAAVQALISEQENGGGTVKLIGFGDGRKHARVISATDLKPRPLKDVFIRTFGFFDVFVDGVPFSFKSGKAKELLAILVDRKGGLVSSREAISLLWEDEEYDSVTQARFRKVAMRLNRELESIGIENIVEVIDRKRRINAQFVTCDLFEYLNGNPEYTERFDGNYMLNYSWGEYTLSNL